MSNIVGNFEERLFCSNAKKHVRKYSIPFTFWGEIAESR